MSGTELLILLALAVVFAPLERLWPVRRVRPDWPRLRTDACHVVFTGSVVRWAVSAAMAGLGAFARPLTPVGLGLAVRAQPCWLQFLEIFLLSDFAFYWAHRLSHAVPVLWRFHQVHHSSEKLDWIAGHRVHPLDQTLNSGLIAASTVLFGFSPGPLLVFALIYRFHAVLLHSNVRVAFGPLRWIISSPHYHHWHHADHPTAWNRNFGGQLVIFDLMFGTLNLPPPGRLPEKYGLSEPFPRDYVGQILKPFGVSLPRTRAGDGVAGEELA